MQLGITIPLQKHLKLQKQQEAQKIDLFFCWEFHILRYQGKNTLIGVNANNRFFVMLSNLKGTEFHTIIDDCKYAIMEGMTQEGYTKEQIDAYFSIAGQPMLCKTHGKKVIAGLNGAMDYLESIPEEVDHYEKYQPFHCGQVNRELCNPAGFREYGTAVEFFKKDMIRTGILSE